MAVTHIGRGAGTSYGTQLGRVLDNLEAALDGLNDQIAAMNLMIDGDGSDPLHYVYMANLYGYPTDGVAAKAAWDELNALAGKLNADGNITFVNAAILQAIAKFR